MLCVQGLRRMFQLKPCALTSNPWCASPMNLNLSACGGNVKGNSDRKGLNRGPLFRRPHRRKTSPGPRQAGSRNSKPRKMERAGPERRLNRAASLFFPCPLECGSVSSPEHAPGRRRQGPPRMALSALWQEGDPSSPAGITITVLSEKCPHREWAREMNP